jgi:hypothetical protein
MFARYLAFPKPVRMMIAVAAFLFAYVASSPLSSGLHWIVSVAVGGFFIALVPLE